ncbi:hypothetical protein N431DRAFT_357902, partial [Stipitochalara longipes BDJ]
NQSPLGHWFDPFHILPIDERGNSYALIRQYDALFGSWYTPVTTAFSIKKEEFISFAISDPALLHATLAHLAMTFCNPEDMFYHIGQAINLVNKRISDSSHESITMETIFAIVCLTSLELRSGSVASIKIHLDGLEALVEGKGGMQSIARDKIATVLLYWIDMLCSIILDTKPRFKYLNQSSHPDFKKPESNSISGLRYKKKLFNLTGFQDLSQETTEIFDELNELIAKKVKVLKLNKMDATEEDIQNLRIYIGRFIHRLIALAQYKVLDIQNQNSLIYRLFGNAALAHVLMFTCGINRRVCGIHVLTSISARIRTSLELVDVRYFQIAYPEMMLWIIMIGGLAGAGAEDQGWFARLLGESCCAAGIIGADELAISLTGCIWSDSYFLPIFKGFWDDFAAEQA